MEKNGKTSSNNNYFVGTYYHTLEDNGRVSVPKSFRKNLKSGSIITRGLDGCLTIYTKDSWDHITTKLQALPISQKAARDFLRSLTYNASPVEFDNLGRTRIPDNLIDTAGLIKDVVFAGSLTKIDVWDKNRFHDYYESLQDIDDDIEESLRELGI